MLEYAHEQYSSLIHDTLGKGKRMAGLLYRQWMKQGRLCFDDPAFINAQRLVFDICALTDFSFPLLSTRHFDDETCKFLIQTADGYEVESVRIPMKTGATLCISSQVGCKRACAFCETGRMGLLRNLTAREIVSQAYIARFGLGFSVQNIVFMGMGEPFDNYDEVMKAIKVLTDQHGLAFGMQNITVSTSGNIEGILRLACEKDIGVHLAVSVNAPHDELRTKLMPHNRKESMKVLYDAMHEYCEKSGRMILVAYVLLKGINDDLSHAEALVKYLAGLDIKVNLIPYNAQEIDRFSSPNPEKVEAFAAFLKESGLRVLVRQNKGRSINAACGQLSTSRNR
jgi:23S rRNA (adenine2503-C2)-methyltransferase